MEKWRLKKGDQVFVISGKDKGKTGKVSSVLREKNKILVQGVNIFKRNRKPTSNSAGGIEQKEMPIHVSNVMHLDPKDQKPTRIGIKFLEDGRKIRFAKRSGEHIDK